MPDRPEVRYLNDPAFHELVMRLSQLLLEGRFSGHDLEDAVFLARMTESEDYRRLNARPGSRLTVIGGMPHA